MESKEVLEFEGKRLKEHLLVKEAEVRELYGRLSGIVLHLDSDVMELQVSLEQERIRRREAGRLFVCLYADHNTQVGALRDVYLQINTAMATVGFPPFVPHDTFDEPKMDHLVILFCHLARELTGLWLRMEVTLEEEGE